MERKSNSTNTPYTPPPIQPVPFRRGQNDEWEKAAEGLDYSKDLPKQTKAQKKPVIENQETGYDWTNMTKGLGVLIQGLVVLLGLGLLAFAIYAVMQGPKNRVISKDGTKITLANIEEYLHETDLDQFLRSALSAGNWSLAVRLYFLQAIKLLSEKGAISWSKEKTNRDYQRELGGHQLAAGFKETTRQYERIWYGNHELNEETFIRLEPRLKSFLNQIKAGQ